MSSLPPPPDVPAPQAAVCALADGLATTLRLAAVLVCSRRPVDLAGLDRQIGLLCAKSLDLGPEDGRRMRPVLDAVLAEVVALTQALSAAHGVPAD